MKNVTIALDDETHRRARIRAAELGTSLSALVKDYLVGLSSEEPPINGVREMQAGFMAAPQQAEGPPWFINGKWVYTPDGKPRQPGAMRNFPLKDGWDDPLPDDIIDAMYHWDESDFDPLP